jgi:hypothetical protein
MRSREMLSYFGLSDVPFGKEIPTDELLVSEATRSLMGLV